MALRKFQSLDYGARDQPVGVAQEPSPTTAGGGSGSQRPAHLPHSVSIVVELAREQSAPASSSLEDAESFERSLSVETSDESTTSKVGSPMTARAASNRQPSKLVARRKVVAEEADEDKSEDDEPDEDEDRDGDDDDDDETDDDDRQCLSSKLARRVVIVDEADKILRTRAHSAEPHVCPPEPVGQLGRTFFAAGRPLEIGIGAGEAAMATCSGGGWSSRAAKCANCSSGPTRSNPISGSSGELAERGELSKLSMRRNTVATAAHNQPQQKGAQGEPCAQQQCSTEPKRFFASGGSSATSSIRRHSQAAPTSLSSLTHGTCAQHGTHSSHNQSNQLQQQPQQQIISSASSSALKASGWHQRRQSLQISLLTGGPLSLPCRSLNEEELRGEREFNEQVRSAKSPELFHLHHSHHRYHSSLLHLTQQHTHTQSHSPHQQEAPAIRCKSTGGFEPNTTSGLCVRDTQQKCSQCELSEHQVTPAVSSSRQYQQNIALRNRQNQQQAKQRRVSFSCIDPVIRRGSGAAPQAEPATAPSGPQQSRKCAHVYRASVAFYLTQGAEVHPKLDGAGHLERPTRSPTKTTSNPTDSIGSILKKPLTTARANSSTCSPTGSGLDSSAETSLDGTESLDQRLAQPAGVNRFSKRHSLASRTASGSSPPSSQADEQQPQQSEQQDQARRRLSLHTTPSPSKSAHLEHKRLESFPELAAVRQTTNIMSEPSSRGKRAGGSGAHVQTFSEKVKTAASTTSAAEPTLTETMEAAQEKRENSRKVNAENDKEKVQTIMANARLRQEQFAKLLEEHEQIVNEINRSETKISSSHTNLQHQ